jgi:hypothetical protein
MTQIGQKKSPGEYRGLSVLPSRTVAGAQC